MEFCKNKPLDEIFLFFNYEEFDRFLNELNGIGLIGPTNTPICYSINNIDEQKLKDTKYKYIIHWHMKEESFSIESYSMDFNHKMIATLKLNPLFSDIEMYLKLP